MKTVYITLAAMFLTSPALAEDLKTFDIIIKDHKFSPASVEIPADQKVKLLVKNQDATPEEFESHDFNREKIIPGNSQATIFVGPLKAGEYKFFGEFNEATAQGKLIVK
ncbi:MAG: cupredoxin domain-containing protein [Alphaproteobacteria bacterium]|nr:cupredoxin domain-containing protein [Alphaproteobacteria bacterium]